MRNLLSTANILILSAILFLAGCGGTSSTSSSSSTTASTTTVPSSRSDFVRTDDTPASIAYDSSHNLLFVCNSVLSLVDVISTTTKQIVKKIHVSGAFGLTITPDDSLVYVGGHMQKLAAISTASLTVVHRYTLPQNGGNFFAEPTPMATSNGIFMLGYGSSGFGFFSPSTGAINGNTKKNGCMLGNIIARSPDGTKVLVASDTYPGFVSLIDVKSASCVAQRQFQNPVYAVAANSNDTQFAVAVKHEPTYILDANLNIVGTAPVGGLPTGIAYSPDGSHLYIVTDPTGQLPIIATIDTTTLGLAGTAPAYGGLNGYAGGPGEIPEAADSTGMIFGIADDGVAFDDATFYQDFSSTDTYPVSFGATPTEGSATTATPVTISINNVPGLPGVWFGPNQATNVSTTSTTIQATAPPSTQYGPVNIRIFEPGGESAIMPQAFSYGPSAITYGTLAGAPQGGATANLFGNGFSADVPGAPINVRIGGQAAPVTEAEYSNDGPYPLYLQHLQVTVPPGTPGAQNITISAPDGTTTISNGFHYLKSVTDYPTADKLLDILYDPTRQQIYLSAGDHIDVFALSDSSYLPPIVPPTLSGQVGLRGMALTPGGAELLAANYLDDSVAVISPDDPSTATAVQIVPPGTYLNPVPAQLATTSLNTAFVDTGNASGFTGGGGSLYLLDLATLQATLDNPGLSFLEVSGVWINSSSDGSRVIITNPDGGPALLWNAASNNWIAQSGGSLVDGTVSNDGNVYSTVGPESIQDPVAVTFIGPQGNILGNIGLPNFLREMLPPPGPASPTYLPGVRLNSSGSLVYVPFAHGIDIYDVHHGNLREQILLTEQMSNGGGPLGDLATRIVHDMAIDGTGQKIFLITNKGLTIAQLDSVPLSIGSVTPASGAAGTQVKIRGSGFVQGVTASANGTPAQVSYVDSQTLQLTLPSLSPGAVQVKVTNPDGQNYTLDDAFTVQ